MNETTATTKEEVWKLFEETARQMREQAAETDRQIQELGREIRALSAKTDRELAETARQVKETSRSIKDAKKLFETQWGALIESLARGKLVELLQNRGIKDITQTLANMDGWLDYMDDAGRKQRRHCELDIIAKNGVQMVVVEVKTTLWVHSVNKFLWVLERFHQLMPEYRDKTIYGAVAYLRSREDAHLYAQNEGLFVIRATGDSANIINPKDFKPKVFPESHEE